MPAKKEQEVAVFRPHKPGIRKILGDLEADIMEVIWEKDPGAKVTVRDIHSELQEARGAAYTTVMTVMGILAKKGLLKVEKDSFAHRYSARQTRDAFTREAVGDIIDQLLGDFAEPALAHFAETFERQDASKINLLQDLIARRRQNEA